MTFVITDACVGVKDGACAEVCPCDCIHPTRNESDHSAASQLYIDPSHCIDCGLCVGECPVDAIHPEGDLPSGLERFVQINADWYQKEQSSDSQ